MNARTEVPDFVLLPLIPSQPVRFSSHSFVYALAIALAVLPIMVSGIRDYADNSFMAVVLAG